MEILEGYILTIEQLRQKNEGAALLSGQVNDICTLAKLIEAWILLKGSLRLKQK